MQLDQAAAKLAALRTEIQKTKREEKALIKAASEEAALDAALVDIERREADLAAAKVSLSKAKASAPAAPSVPPRPAPAPTKSEE